MGEKRVIEQVASNEVHNDDWFLKDSPTKDTSKISATNLKAILGADGTLALDEITNAIAKEYDSTSTYNKDDFVFYENKLYRCLANNTTGTWDGTKWEEFDLPTALITTAHNIETAEFTIGTYYSADDLVLKDGKLYQCVVGHNATEWKSQFWRAVTVDTMLDYLSSSLAPEHNPSTVYAVGDLVTHNKALWRCTQAGAGAFVNANWEEVTVVRLIAEAGKIDDVQVKTTGDYETVVENKIAKIDLSSVTAYGEVPNLPQAIATFKDGADAPMKSLKVAIEPQQEGSGDPSPTNIRPISGWSEANVGVAGKNLFGEINPDKWINADGDLISDADSMVSQLLVAKANQQYVLSSSNPISTLCICFYDKDMNKLLRVAQASVGQITATAPIGSSFMYAGSYKSHNNLQLEFGSTPTEYTPYTGSHTYTIDLDGTRYGGHVEAVSGVMVITDGMVDLGDLTWNLHNSGNFYTDNAVSDRLPNCWAICEKYTKRANEVTSVDQVTENGVFSFQSQDNVRGRIIIRDTAYTTASDFKTAVAGVKLVYELATPLTIQLTPTQVKSLLGSNNVWADTGDINECVYRRDMNTTINDIIARLEALEG